MCIPIFPGRGATLFWTQEYIAVLHNVIGQVKVAMGVSRVHVLDIPCGDMAWMSRFLETRDDVDYTGVDIVPDLIENHGKKFKHKINWRFLALDALEEPLPTGAHIIICRTLLQHLFMSDLQTLLTKFSASGANYLLTTTFPAQTYNTELELVEANPGRFRRINLELPPVSLTPPMCLMRDGPPEDFEGWDHFAGLWKLPLTQVFPCNQHKKFKVMMASKEVSMASCLAWSPYIDIS